MIREALPKIETEKSFTVFQSGSIYTSSEGLPGFSEAREFTVHHTEQVANTTVLWFSGPDHSLDYAILGPNEKIQPTKKENEKQFEYPEKKNLGEMFKKEGSFAIEMDSTNQPADMSIQKLLAKLYKEGGYFSGHPRVAENPHVTIGKTEFQTPNTEPEAENTEPKNYQSTRLLSFGRDLLATLAEDNSTKTAEFAKALRLMIVAEKKFQRTTPAMPEWLWQPDQYADPDYQVKLKTWLKLYYNSAYHDLPDHNDVSELLKRSKEMPEKSSTHIITLDSILPAPIQETGFFQNSPQKSKTEKNTKYINTRFGALMSNLRLQASQTNEQLSLSPTFKNEAFSDPFYNDTKKSGLTARTKSSSELLGTFVVALNGTELPDPLPEPEEEKEEAEETTSEKKKKKKKRKGTLEQRAIIGLKNFITKPQEKVIKRPPHQYARQFSEEFIGGGPDSRISFYFKNPVGPDGSNVGRVPYGFEIFCPKTKNAETVKNLLLHHPDLNIRVFYQLLDDSGYITISGDHHLLCKITDDFSSDGIKKTYADSPERWKESMQFYQKFLNPIKVLGGLGCLDPQSSNNPPFSTKKDSSILKTIQ